MRFTPHAPVGVWSPFVEAIFHYDSFHPDHSIERVVPTGHVFILFALDGQARHLYDTSTLHPIATLRDVWVAGVHRNHLSISAHQDSRMLVVEFAHWGAHPFLHRPVVDLADRVVAREEVFDGQLPDLHRRIVGADSVAGMFAVVDEWLGARFEPDRTPPAALVDVVDDLLAAPAARFAQAVASWPHSPKHLASQFRRYVGLTPKAFHRVARFQALLEQVQGGEDVAWSDIAYLTGFSDQSHFVREFRAFSGLTPTQFRRLGLDEQLNFFALDAASDEPTSR